MPIDSCYSVIVLGRIAINWHDGSQWVGYLVTCKPKNEGIVRTDMFMFFLQALSVDVLEERGGGLDLK